MTIERIYQDRIRKVQEAEFASLCSPASLEDLVIGGVSPTSKAFEVSDLALRVRLTQESVKSVAHLEETLRSTSDAATQLQQTANTLNNVVVRLTWAIFALTLVQAVVAVFMLVRSGL